MNFDKICNSILERVFHGTPHDVIGSFSLNKIGSGEGAQVYGWGLYFAENPKVADSYRKNVTHKDFINKVAEVYDEYSSPEEADEALESAGLNANQMALVKALQKEDWWGFDYPHQAVAAALKEPDNFEHGEEVDRALKTFGNLYEVEINADKENDFLDWDKPLSEQSEKVKNAVVPTILSEYQKINKARESILKRGTRLNGKPLSEDEIEKYKKPMPDPLSITGKAAYTYEVNSFGGRPHEDSPRASKYLLSKGVLGIRYLDQDSRNIGEGTHNYVIFDPSIIKIVSKNGEFVMQSKTPENVEI